MINKITYSDYNKTPFLLDWLSDSDVEKRLAANDKQFQEIEDCAFDMIDHFWITSAVGSQLDILGALVLAKRKGFDDESFRTFIKLQAEVNVKAGSPEAVISTVFALIGNNNFKYEHSYPGKVVITSPEKFQIYIYYTLLLMDGDDFVFMDGSNLSLRDRIINNVEFILDVVPAGVDVELIDAPII
jgi:hypothetical protein